METVENTPPAPTLVSHSSHSPDDGDHGSLFAELDVHNFGWFVAQH